MTRSETVAALRGRAEQLRRLGATGLYLFGSSARDEADVGSDVDVFVDYDPRSDFSFVELIRIKDLVAQLLNREVDLTTRAGLHPRLKSEIERTSVKVF